jgi:hypothetical protein
MSASSFHPVPKVPDSVAHLDPDVVVETLSRHAINVSDAAGELGVASADLRRLLWANPKLADAAIEIEERRLDLAERNIFEALKSDDPSPARCGEYVHHSQQPSRSPKGLDHDQHQRRRAFDQRQRQLLANDCVQVAER